MPNRLVQPRNASDDYRSTLPGWWGIVIALAVLTVAALAMSWLALAIGVI